MDSGFCMFISFFFSLWIKYLQKTGDKHNYIKENCRFSTPVYFFQLLIGLGGRKQEFLAQMFYIICTKNKTDRGKLALVALLIHV